ncbi:MAG: Pyruvate formate-lyase 1-activating enzyme [candidate division WS2 bacterium]|nr:Pyruvate formate-lyase 1-activating enzyme [Candidatus Lithacetigena glycinireducens]
MSMFKDTKQYFLFVFFILSILLFYKLINARRTIPNKMKEAMFYQKLDNLFVQCKLCFRKCTIANNKRGFCRVRENRKGKLYSLVYGRPLRLQIDPIELEPMYHMLPGHKNLCVYTPSCNFRCKHCHNWDITQRSPDELKSQYYLPEEVVEEAIRRKCKSISHSINEPAIFYEYMLDIMKIAKQKGLLTLFHTNGSLSPQPLREILKYTDGVTVDLKAFTEKFYKEICEAELLPVLETLKIIKEEKVHLEIVNLIIPTLNDDMDKIKEMCLWIKKNLGDEVPIHFTRFSPSYKLTNLPLTPIKTLEKAREIAKDIGLKYVYIGNVAGHEGNNTYCPKCNAVIIRRTHFVLIENKVGKEGVCKFCKTKIVGIWDYP